MCVEATTPLPTAGSNEPVVASSPSVSLSTSQLASHRPFTPINISALKTELSKHPDREFVSFLLDGLSHGFRIGYTGPRDTLISSNLSSALNQPEIVSQYLSRECEHGHTAGPYETPPCSPFRSAGVGVVPKKSGGHRLIVHLSAPNGCKS